MFCPNCGKEMNDGASFCSSCGYKLKSSNNIKNVFNNVKDFANGVRLKFLKLDLKKRIIIVVSIIIVLLLLIILKGTVAKKDDLSIKIANAKMVSEYSTDTTIEEMDTVTFGLYPQSDASGNVKEPIEWIVLDRQGNKALLLSKYILDCKRYTNKDADITWKTCSLRNWLNNDFYYRAFSSDEQRKIVTTNVINNNNIDYGTNGGNNTNDKIFCLSIEETRKYFGNGTKRDKGYQLGKNVATRGTNYAKAVDNDGDKLHVSDEYSEWFIGNSVFWLRSPGIDQYAAARVGGGGYLYTHGNFVGIRYFGVRPALWVSNLSSSISKSKTQKLFFSNLFKKTGWVEEKNNKYYYDDKGNKIVSDWQEIDGNWYYFDIDGKCVINDWRKIDDAYYYFNEEGIMQKDKWIENKYYVNASGKMLANTLTPDGYYVNKDGERVERICFTTQTLLNIVKEIPRDPNSLSAWLENEGFNGDWIGELNAIDEGGFDIDGSWWLSFHGGPGESRGAWFDLKIDKYGTKTLFENSHWLDDYYSMDSPSHTAYFINGNEVSADVYRNEINHESGYTPIVLEDLNLKGWYLIGNYYCYFGDGGKMYTNQWIDGKYYVDSEGHMLVNTYTPDGYYVDYNGEYVKDINTTVIYLNGYYYLDGAKLVNAWIKYGNNSYYLDENGNIVRNKWIDGRYVGSSGAMYVGAMTPDGKYVNLDGYVVNDVNKDLKDSMKEKNVEGEAWYKTKAGLWYYFEKDRKTLRKGWFIDSRDNQTYYLDKDTGIMAVGWTEIDGSLYYFNESYENEPNWYEVGDGIYESFGKKVKSYGSMYKNEMTPDGKQVDENGKLIETSISNNISNANGDIIKFGNYMITSSENKDAIEWIVLDKQNGKALLLSKYIIDCKCYNETRDKVTWETCSLRKWLNNDFYNAVFTNDEKNKILTTNLNQIDNPNNNKSKGGNPTNDKIFLLSIDEVQKYFNQHGLSPDNQNLAALPTEYAKSKDNNGEKLWVNNDSSVWHNGYGYFWLRSPGIYQRDAAGVDSNGGLDIEGRYVDVSVIGVRPAMWVSLE